MTPEPRSKLHRFWRRFLARFRLSLTAVCEESAGGEREYHDYPDDVRDGSPYHFITYHCRRCGKAFEI